MVVNFKSKHKVTISFTQDSFSTLLGKQWDVLECNMVDGQTISMPRHQVVLLWASSRDWRKVPHSKVMIKILKIG